MLVFPEMLAKLDIQQSIGIVWGHTSRFPNDSSHLFPSHLTRIVHKLALRQRHFSVSGDAVYEISVLTNLHRRNGIDRYIGLRAGLSLYLTGVTLCAGSAMYPPYPAV